MVFLGPNGSGKTTCIRMMCGLLTPDSGNGSCLGFDILHETSSIKQRIGYMMKKFSFWEDLTIKENLACIARLYEMKNRKDVVNQALELLLLDEPAAGVDPTARRDFWDELNALADQGISVLVSTHYMDEAERCHKLAYITYGKLLATGTSAEIIASQNLNTLAVYGDNLNTFAKKVEKN